MDLEQIAFKVMKNMRLYQSGLFGVSFNVEMHFMKHSLFTINIAPTFYFLVYFSKLGVKYQKDNL